MKVKIVSNTVLLITVSLFFLSTSGYAAQDPPENPPRQYSFVWETMIANFSSLTDPGKTYVEITMSALNGQFKFQRREDNYYYALLQYDVEIKDKEDNPVDRQTWQRVIKVSDPVEAEKFSSLEIVKFLIAPGTYSLNITLTDLFDNQSVSLPSVLSIPRFSSSIVSLSDIQFASNIKAATEDNDFVKHGAYYVEPFPARVYSNTKPMMYFYVEIYNLGKPKNDDDVYIVDYQIINQRGEQVHKVTKTRKKPQSGVAVIAEQVNTLKLKNDYYTLYIKVTDSENNFSAERRDQFVVFKPNEVSTERAVPAVNFENEITPNNIKNFWNQLEYIVASGQKKTFESYDFERKKQFISDFWATKSVDYFNVHIRNFNYAQENFKALTIEGWRSDRGRIYITYGPPSQMEDNPADPGMKPWQAWVYTELKGQGEIVFIFGNVSGFGNYELLHSNIQAVGRSEIFDPDWQRRLIIR